MRILRFIAEAIIGGAWIAIMMLLMVMLGAFFEPPP